MKLGCESDTPAPVARLGGEDFYRCPRATARAEDVEVLTMAERGYLKGLTERERRRLPARLVLAVEFVTSLKGRAHGD